LKYDPWLAPPIEGEIIPEPEPKPEPEPEREPEPDDSPPLAQPVIRDDGTDPTMRPGDPTPEEIAAATAEIKRIHVESLMAGDVLHAGLNGKPSGLGRLGFSRKRGRPKGVIRS
jgi:predicted component of type VI protein secretion system